MSAHVRHVVFDWNGTLLDDVELAAVCVGRLAEQTLGNTFSLDHYRRQFRFPIRSFYGDLGFAVDDLSFHELMKLYLAAFNPESLACGLHAGAYDLLKTLSERGLGLSVLSASHQIALDRGVASAGLASRFKHVWGIDDKAAAGKVHRAIQLQERLGVPAGEVLYVGDTLHDAEVAEAAGWQAVLFSGGHQHVEILRQSGLTVIDRLPALLVVLEEANKQMEWTWQNPKTTASESGR